MRKLMLWGALAIMLVLIPSCGHAQGQGSGILYASDFNAWSLPQGTAPAAGMIQWPTAAICQVSSNGYSFTAIKVGRPLTVVDVVPSQTETVIPTAVTTSGGSCTVTAPMTHLHLSYSVRSGTSGLQEAIDYSAKIVGGSLVILTPGWTAAGGVSSMITSAYGQSATSILDERVATLCQYAWNGSAYAAAGCSTDAASLSTLTLQTFAGPLAVPQGITAPITGHASLDLSLAGGTLSGPLVAPQVNASYTPAPGSALQSIITTAGANSDIALSCGTYSVAVGGLTIPSANVHLHGISRDCTFVNFSGPAGLSVSGANVQIDGITFEGPTNNYTIQAETTAHGFNLHNSRITGGGSALGASQNSAALEIVAPNQDIWVKDNEFTGDGVAGNSGYVLKTDGAAAGYVVRTHIVGNWFHDNISPDVLYGFDLGDGSEISSNTIDQGNICGGTLCNNPAGNGVGYSIMLYSEAYGCATLSGQFTCNVLLTRSGNVVTAVMGGFLPSWPLHVGDPIFLETAQFGTNGTDFNGVFPLTAFGTSVTGGSGYTTANGLATTGGSGTGATVNITAVSGSISTVTVANAGTGYTFGDKLTIVQGGGSGGYAVVAKVTGGVINAVANYGITWNQTAPNDTDDHIPGDAGLAIPPLPNVKIQTNTVNNSSGACVYIQGASNNNIVGNILTQCDLQSQAGGHPQSAIGLNGVWGGSVTGNSIDGVGLTHGIGADNAYTTAIAGNNISNIPLGYGIQLFDSWRLAINGNSIDKAARGGIGGDTNPDPNCFGCSLDGNTIRMMAAGSAYSFNGADSNISITGGFIHAPSTGLSNSAVFLGASTSKITVSAVTIDCQPDGQAGTATTSYGIRANTGSHNNVIRGNTITGCNAASGAGILDTGTDDILDGNTVNGSGFGVLANGGTRQLITSNFLWGNSSSINVTGSTGSVVFCNQLTQGGTPTPCAPAFDYTLPTYTFGSNTSTSPEEIDINSSAGQQRLLVFMSGGVARWGVNTESNAETGSDAGSPFTVRAYHDNGTTIDTPIAIVRAAGGTETHTRPVVLPSLKVTGAAGASTFCLQIDNAGNVSNTGSGCGASGAGVASINGTAGSYTFAGAGVSCTGTTCTFAGAGGTNFSGITAGTNTTAAMLVGTGASLGTTGSGTIQATSLTGNIPESQVTNLTSDLAAKAATATTVNGHALSANVTVSATDISTGTLPAAQLPAQYKIKPCGGAGIGDGQNIIPITPTATYPINYQCYNDYGVTYTITSIQCASALGSPTVTVADNSGNALLTGPITATSTWAAGTQSATTTLAAGAWVNWSFVADGVSKQIQCKIKGTI